MDSNVLEILRIYFDNEELKNTLLLERNNYSSLIIDLSVSHKCNLKCKHCYYGESTLCNKELELDEWISLINNWHSVGCRHFHISGKESSLDKKTMLIIRYIKTTFPDTFCGVISNGSGSSEYYSQISSYIDYIEFSIDGFKNNHDYLRGKGNFNNTIKSIKAIQKLINPSKISISTSLYKRNYKSYAELTRQLASIGITRFFAAPILPLGNATRMQQELIDQSQFSETILSLNTLLHSKPLDINTFFCIQHHSLTDFWNNDSLIKKICQKYLSEGEDPIIKASSNIIQFSLDFFNLPFYRQLCVSADGFILPKVDIDYNDTALKDTFLRYKQGNFEAILQKRSRVITDIINSF
nr:radical SAM protein [uncultured Draconibacterium sp.]